MESKRRLNILVFSWRDPKHPQAGGAEQVMHEHMKGWISAGHAVTLFSSSMPGLPRDEFLDGVKIVRGGYQYLGVQIAGFIYYLENRKHFDLVVDQFHGIPFFTPVYVRVPKIAVLQEVAGKVWLLNPLPFPLNKILGWMAYFFEPLIFPFYKSTTFIVGSNSAKKELSKKGIPERNIHIIPHGVIIIKPKSFPKKEKRKTVIYLGALSQDKGVEDAIKCFDILNRKGDYNFWVIGKPESKRYREHLSEVCKELKLSRKVKFWGYVSNERKFELLARAHVMVNPSVHEGWGLVNIEANAMGVPVAAYRSAGLVDSIKDGQSGLFSDKNTPICLAETVTSLLSSSEKYKRLQGGAIAWSNKFSWKESKKLSLDLIESLK